VRNHPTFRSCNAPVDHRLDVRWRLHRHRTHHSACHGGRPELADKRRLDRLVKVLVIEVCTVCIAMFTGHIELPETVKPRVEDKASQRTIDAITPQIENLNREIEVREAKVREYMKKVPPAQVDPADRVLLDKPLKIDPKAFRLMRPQ
jgi:putative ubiquitin-RnfH superfamily antitoxin RatB of RatAB toxin-antitoxin module